MLNLLFPEAATAAVLPLATFCLRFQRIAGFSF